jgi:bifunctional DNase/RNase
VQVPRPLTHAFTANLLRAAGARVSEVRVHRLAEETFYAQVVLNGREGEKLVDARPSDVVALALELGAPMYVAAEVMDEVEAALPRDQAERLDHASAGIGAGQIVRELIERWPREPKPTLPGAIHCHNDGYTGRSAAAPFTATSDGYTGRSAAAPFTATSDGYTGAHAGYPDAARPRGAPRT